MPNSVASLPKWFGSFGSHTVVLSSPHPPGECLRRLATVTTRRGYTWYLTSGNVGYPDSRLRGGVNPSRILVARFQETLGRNSFVPWLDGRPESSPEGGTVLTGRIALHPAVRLLISMIAGVGSLIVLTGLIAGVAQLVSGQLGEALPFVSIPLVLVAAFVGLNVAGLRSLEREIPKLVHDLNRILDSAHDGATS